MLATYTEEEKENIIRLGSRGVPDSEIGRLLDIKISVVSPITAKFWKEKMKNKNES